MPAPEPNVPPETDQPTEVEIFAYSDNAPPARTVAVCAIPEEVSLAKRPSDLAAADTTVGPFAATPITAAPEVELLSATNKEAFTVPVAAETLLAEVLGEPPCALATDAPVTDVKTPAVSAVTTVSEIRLRSVDFDIFFLSLVRFRNFLSLARRPFDLPIPFPCGTHV